MEKIIKFISSEEFKINIFLAFVSIVCFSVLLVFFIFTSLFIGVAENIDAGVACAIKVTIFFSLCVGVLSLLTSDRLGYYIVVIVATAIIASASSLSLIQEGFNLLYLILLVLSFIFPLPPERCPYKPRKHFLKKMWGFILSILAIKVSAICLNLAIFYLFYNLPT